jgi:hypothetical protein
MKLTISFIIALFSVSVLVTGASSSQDDKQAAGDKFVYADFEKVEDGRAVSNAGGLVQVYTAHESTPVKFKGLANAAPGAPELIVLKDAPQNHLAAFEYNLVGPNQWANVTLEIQGRPLKDGKPVADDVSGYKHLSLQLYATGVDYLRVEFVSHGQGINLTAGFPQLPIRLKQGLNTYLIPLKGLSQPAWVQDRVDSKEVLKKLTAISISAYCNQCTPQQGMVLVDNLVFQK